MQIVVAITNIFRRELSSYVLGEAGYSIREAHSVAGLLSLVRTLAPDLLVIDGQLEGGEPPVVLRAVRHLSAAPILWIAEPSLVLPLVMVDTLPGHYITWPYRANELLQSAASLLGRTPATLRQDTPPQCVVGSIE